MQPGRLTGGALLAVALALALLAPGADAGAKSVHIRGTAYEFNNVDLLLSGAKIRVAERPRLHATVKRDGTYDLTVPDHATVTPYIVAAGHHTIYLQTFRTDGEDLDRVNFQTPTESIYRALAALLSVPLRPNGELRDCAIVSTFSTRNVRDLRFRRFTAYGAHGIGGATAFGKPALPKAVYFNEDVIPDPAQRALLGRRRGRVDPCAGRRLPDPGAASLHALRELRRHVPAGARGEREPAMGPPRARPAHARDGVGRLVGGRTGHQAPQAPCDGAARRRDRANPVHRPGLSVPAPNRDAAGRR